MHQTVTIKQRSGIVGVRLVALFAVSLLAGCVDALPSWQMPDNVKDTRKLLSREEQQQAIHDLSQKKAAQQAEAARQAEKPKN